MTKLKFDNLKISIYKEDDLYVATCPSLDINASDFTIEKAVRNLVDVIKESLNMLKKEGVEYRHKLRK